ncbi:MAG: VCBS repeat-containing protein, partial [Bacteroidota bacterium]
MKAQILPGSFLAIAAIFLLFSCKKDPSGQASATQAEVPANAIFELLPAAQTGVNFSNTIRETFEENILKNSYLYNGGGVAILDANNDGLPDLYFTATQGSNRLYLNKGSLKFEDITDLAGVAGNGGVKTGVTIADVNADGWQDIYVCRSGALPDANRGNLLYINNGAAGMKNGVPVFTERSQEFGLNDRSPSNHANFFDYDLDG